MLEYNGDLIQFMCCDCALAENHGICGDYSENASCPYKEDDGSCWTPCEEE